MRRGTAVGLVALPIILSVALLVHASGRQITGQVEDSSDAIIPKARVLLIKVDDLTTQSTNADQQGRFSFTGLDPVEYEIKVAYPAFRTGSERVQLGCPRVVTPNCNDPMKVTVTIRLKVGGSP